MPHKRKQVGAVVPHRAFLHRRDDAGGNADQKSDHDRHRGQLHRHRQFFGDQVAHGNLDTQGFAEVAGRNAFDPIEILHRDRSIEPVLLAYLRDHGGIAFFSGHDERGIAGQQVLQQKDQDRHEEQCRNQLQDAFAEKVQHAAYTRPNAAELDIGGAARRVVSSPLVGEGQGEGWLHRQSPSGPPTPTLPHKGGGSREEHGASIFTSVSNR